MKIQKIKLSKLNPDLSNTRVHDKYNIDVIKKSLLKFKQYRPLVIQKNGMIIRVGNGTYQAMKELGIKDVFCVIKAMTDEEATTLSILDNKSSDLSYFDDKLLAKAMSGLNKELLELTGFKGDEIDKYFSEKINLHNMLENLDIDKIKSKKQSNMVVSFKDDKNIDEFYNKLLQIKNKYPAEEVSKSLFDYLEENKDMVNKILE